MGLRLSASRYAQLEERVRERNARAAEYGLPEVTVGWVARQLIEQGLDREPSIVERGALGRAPEPGESLQTSDETTLQAPTHRKRVRARPSVDETRVAASVAEEPALVNGVEPVVEGASASDDVSADELAKLMEGTAL